MLSRYAIVLVLCATLGLAPFLPEPHLIGKIRWVAGGAVGMTPMDAFDLVFHGSPYLVLVGMGIYDVIAFAMRRGATPAAQGADET